MSKDPLPAIAEDEASGETARLFADIRETLGLGVVNLVWRHLATIPGGLAWTWGALKPLYASGRIGPEAGGLLAGLSLDRLAPLTDATLRSVGIDPGARPVILAVVESYNRGNCFNVLALSALLVPPDGPRDADGSPPGPAPEVGRVDIPPLPAMDGLDPGSLELILALNELGKRSDDPVVASMYRHLAHWPAMLGLAWAMFQPLAGGGRLETMIAEVERGVRGRAARLADGLGSRTPAPAAVHRALGTFSRDVITRMIPLCAMLRQALVDGAAGGRV